MEKEQFRSNALDMLYLTRCAVNGETADQTRVAKMNLDTLFSVCQKHILTACTAYALEAVGVRKYEFSQAKEKAIRKNILLDTERKKILHRLEQEKIWYIPLKGSLLKDWYPKLGMRQMSDNDILCNSSKRAQIKNIMLDLGFSCEHFGKGNVDAYFKKPVCNFEMHNELFTVGAHDSKLYEYYADVKERLIKDKDNAFGYHFKDEDFYLYITAHEYKHYASGGTGVRSLLDIYIFIRKFGDSLDWEYIRTELTKLKIEEFEQQSRELAMKLFTGKALTDAESEMLDYYIFSGTYGTIQHKVKNNIEKLGNGSKAKYIFRRIFPPMNQIKAFWPFFYQHKWLIPVLWIYRLFHGICVNGKKIWAEVLTLAK